MSNFTDDVWCWSENGTSAKKNVSEPRIHFTPSGFRTFHRSSSGTPRLVKTVRRVSSCWEHGESSASSKIPQDAHVVACCGICEAQIPLKYLSCCSKELDKATFLTTKFRKFWTDRDQKLTNLRRKSDSNFLSHNLIARMGQLECNVQTTTHRHGQHVLPLTLALDATVLRDLSVPSMLRSSVANPAWRDSLSANRPQVFKMSKCSTFQASKKRSCVEVYPRPAHCPLNLKNWPGKNVTCDTHLFF